MYFMNRIIGYLTDIGDYFYDAYLEVHGWIYPFWYLAYPLYGLHYTFIRLAWYFYDFAEWVDDITDQVGDILSWSYIRSLIRSWLPDLEAAIYWWGRWWVWIRQEIDGWWDYTKLTVQGWIDQAQGWLSQRIDSAEAWLAQLQSTLATLIASLPDLNEILTWFSDWWNKILANIIAWGALTSTQIGSLIDSVVRSYAPFWEGWQDIKGAVFEFFGDPGKWFMDRIEGWLERFW